MAEGGVLSAQGYSRTNTKSFAADPVGSAAMVRFKKFVLRFQWCFAPFAAAPLGPAAMMAAKSNPASFRSSLSMVGEVPTICRCTVGANGEGGRKK